MGTPVSIIIPTYNRAQLLPRAINSVLRERLPDDEILVIDDGSSDETAAVAARYSSVRYIRKNHAGAGPARNLGIAESGNPLVAFLDSDDEWLPGKLALQRRLMEACPAVDFCFSDFRVIDRNGTMYPRYLKQWHQDPRPWSRILDDGRLYSSLAPLPHGHIDFPVYRGNLYPLLLERPYIATFTLLYRKPTDSQAPAFAEDLPIYEDWEFFGQLARGRTGAYLDCETAIQHGHDGARLTQAPVVIQLDTRLRLIRRLWGEDEDFLRVHGSRYETLEKQLTALQQLHVAKEFLRTGRRREARLAFRAIAHYPMLYRLLLLLPGFVVRASDQMRRRLSA